jgi:hypothetical protein
VWAHNSKGFDSYIVLQTTGLKFKNIVKNGGNILWLDVLTEKCKIRFMCTLAHFGAGSLKDIC